MNDPRDAQMVVVVGSLPMVVVLQELQEPDGHFFQKADACSILGKPDGSDQIKEWGAEVVV